MRVDPNSGRVQFQKVLVYTFRNISERPQTFPIPQIFQMTSDIQQDLTPSSVTYQAQTLSHSLLKTWETSRCQKISGSLHGSSTQKKSPLLLKGNLQRIRKTPNLDWLASNKSPMKVSRVANSLCSSCLYVVTCWQKCEKMQVRRSLRICSMPTRSNIKTSSRTHLRSSMTSSWLCESTTVCIPGSWGPPF